MPRDSGGVLRPLGLPLLPTPMDSDAHRGCSLGWLGAVSSLEHHGQVSVALCAGPLGQGCGCGQLLVPCEFSTGRAFMWVPAGLLGPAPALAGPEEGELQGEKHFVFGSWLVGGEGAGGRAAGQIVCGAGEEREQCDETIRPLPPKERLWQRHGEEGLLGGDGNGFSGLS